MLIWLTLVWRFNQGTLCLSIRKSQLRELDTCNALPTGRYSGRLRIVERYREIFYSSINKHYNIFIGLSSKSYVVHLPQYCLASYVARQGSGQIDQSTLCQECLPSRMRGHEREYVLARRAVAFPQDLTYKSHSSTGFTSVTRTFHHLSFWSCNDTHCSSWPPRISVLSSFRTLYRSNSSRSFLQPLEKMSLVHLRFKKKEFDRQLIAKCLLRRE